MTTLLGQFFFLLIFSVALAAVVSAYREDQPARILRGTARRAALFCGAVVVLGLASLAVDQLFLRP